MSPVKTTIRTEVIRNWKAAIQRETQDMFEIDIKGKAKELSPVSDANPKIEGTKYKDTGNNRRLIETEVKRGPKGPIAKLFTQSGYGLFLEIGTRLMRARPYLAPAINMFVHLLGARVAKRIKLHG